MDASDRIATVVPPGEGPSFWVVGDLITFKVDADQTGGAYAMAETTVMPGGGPPPHVHHGEDELFYILEGDLAVVFGDKTLRGAAGSAVHLPKGIPHTFKNVGSTPAKILVTAVPSGFGQFVAEVGTPCTDKACPPPVTPADIDRLLAATPKYGVEMLFQHQANTPAPGPPAGKPLWVMGQHVNVKLTGAETGGSFCVCEVKAQPGEGVLPHAHRREDEIFYVVDGTFEFLLGDKTGTRRVTALPGSFIHVPKGTLHAFKNIGPTTGKLVDYHTPAGFEKFFEEAGSACTDESAGPPAQMPDVQHTLALMARHGMDVPPP